MWDGHFLLPTSSSEDGRSQNMKQTKSNDERSKSGHSVRVHINDDDDRVTSCVKMRIANNKKKKKFKSVLPGKSDPAEPSPMNRRIATVSRRKLLGHGIPSLRRHFLCPCFVPSSEEEEEDTTLSEAEAQRTKLSTSTKLSHSFTSRHANCHRSGSGFVVVVLSNAPYDTPHIATCCLPTHQRLPLSR